MEKVVLNEESLEKLRGDFTEKAFITSNRFKMLNELLKIISALEGGELLIKSGRYTVYGQNKQCNKLKYLGFCKFYFQAINLIGEGSGIIVSRHLDGELKYWLIVNGELNHIDL